VSGSEFQVCTLTLNFTVEALKMWAYSGSLPRAKFHVYSGNVSLLRGEKPIFGPLNKNNTGMAVLRAGLPVTTLYAVE